MCLFGCNSSDGGSASSPPPSSPTCSTTGGSPSPGCCPSFVINSRTTATSPANRARTRLGIAEETVLSTAPSTGVTWSIVGDDGDKGSLTSTSGNSTTYKACDRGKSVTVQAVSACGHTSTIALTIVQISGGTFESPTDISSIAPPSITVGFTGVPTVQPADVSFLNCEMREGTCPAACSGLFASQQGQVHPDTGSWVPFTATVTAQGTQLGGSDTISTTAPIANFPAAGIQDGRFHWPIPWRAQVLGGGRNGEFVFDTLNHVKAYTAASRLLDVSKGGQSAHRTVPPP